MTPQRARFWALAAAAAGLLALLFLETVPGLSTWSYQEGTAHEVIIAFATVITATLALASLRVFQASGAYRSLMLAAALLAFCALYMWHGIFTNRQPAFAFLIYGPSSRLAMAILLLFLATPKMMPRPQRLPAIIMTGAAFLLLAWSAFLAHDAIAAWANSATAAEMTTIRISIETSAGLVAMVAAGLCLWRGGLGNENVAVSTTIFLFGLQSAYFLVAPAWGTTWWAAHALGGLSSLALGTILLTGLRDAEHVRVLHQLRQADEAKTNFINTAAHELGTPLTPIRINLRLLRKDQEFSPEQAKRLDIIDRNVERLIELTSRILDGARSEAGEIPIEIRDVDIAGPLADISNSYRSWCLEKGVDLEVDLPEKLQVRTDARRIQQIASNFLSNAIKHCASAGHIWFRVFEKGNGFRLEVRDDGRGLTVQEQEQLFQPFGQIKDDTMAGGSGLGLFLSREFVERLKGKIGVTSPGLGFGATFYADIPSAR